jgi:hypothetical protein
MVFNSIFSNIQALSWQSVLLDDDKPEAPWRIFHLSGK